MCPTIVIVAPFQEDEELAAESGEKPRRAKRLNATIVTKICFRTRGIFDNIFRDKSSAFIYILRQKQRSYIDNRNKTPKNFARKLDLPNLHLVRIEATSRTTSLGGWT